MMGREDARNMWSFITEYIWITSASAWLFKKKSITMRGNMNVKYAVSVSGTIISSKMPTDLLFPYFFKITRRRILR